jgi:hypothetical protein
MSATTVADIVTTIFVRFSFCDAENSIIFYAVVDERSRVYYYE